MAAKRTVTPLRGGGPAQERELRAQGKKTMRKLLDAGMTVFERRGYHASRVDDIVKVARTSHGTFYLYFASKEDLFRALLANVTEELGELSASLGTIEPGEAGYLELRGWLSDLLDIYTRYGPVIRAWTEAEIDDSEIGRLGDEVLGGFARMLADRVRETNATAGFDPQIAALAVVAMIERFNYYVYSRQIDLDRDGVLDTLAAVVHAGLFGGRRPAMRAVR